MVIEQLEHVYNMAADGTGVRQYTVAVRVQSEATVHQVGVLSLPFASSVEHIELQYVRVRHSDGSVTETPKSEAIEMPSAVTTAAPFYSDLKELHIPVRNLRVGDRLEWQARFVRTKADAPNQFWGEETFLEDAVILSESVELHVPKDMYVNVWSPAYKPTESTTATEHIYRWESSQKNPTVGTDAEAAKERDKKQIWTADQELDEKEGKLPSIEWSTFKSWNQVGEWYRALESDRILPLDPEIKSKVAELTQEKTTQQEKVLAVYEYVSTKIRYIGVAFGIGRFQPHRAIEVLQNQYGDCKDKHTLLAAMLEALGIKADAALIGEGVRFNEAVPAPLSFNHLITHFTQDGQIVWLDTTAEVAPYRVLNPSIRDKSALVVPVSGVAKIERTPNNLPFASYQNMVATGTLDDQGTSTSHIVFTIRGDDELIIRTAFHQLSPGQYEEVVQKLSRSIGYAGTTSHAEVSRPEDTSAPFKISYDYKREKPGNWDKLEIVPQVAPVFLPTLDEKDPPVKSIFLGAPRTENSLATIKLPDGWSATLPADIHATTKWVAFDQTYRLDKGTIYTERSVAVYEERIPVTEWKAYKKFTDDASLSSEQFIQLHSAPAKSATASHADSKPAAKSADPTKAKTVNTPPYDYRPGQLIAAASHSIQRNDFDTAQSQLDQARSINPEQAYLWSMYGFLDYQRGNMLAAITDYKKELELYPNNYDVYTFLASAQNILGQQKEAQESLKKRIAAQPNDTTPYIMLVSMLLEQNHPQEAVAAADDARTHLPEMLKDDQRLRLITGKAQLSAGMKQKGEETLLAIIHTTSDPGMMNDAAYELSEANLDLPLLEKTAREAIDKLSEESKYWNAQDDPQTTAQKSNLIAATWDTIGWILYREGKLAEAKDFIQPACLFRINIEIVKHWAAIAETEGNKDEALRLYEIAQATVPASQRSSARKYPSIMQKEVSEHIAILRKSGAKEPPEDADEALKRMSVVPLGESKGLLGTAEFRLLLGNGQILDAENIGENKIPEAVERIKGIALPAYWPKGSTAQMVRNATINCNPRTCELTFEP
jgi:tetratricopeptide (TPR) repeat protein